MKVVTYLLKQLSPTQVPLGRWRVEASSQTILKIDRSNEDHCGPCGQYALPTKKQQPQDAKTNLK